MKLYKHPHHGFHHPFSGAEEATMRANGWVEHVREAVEPDPEPNEDVAEDSGGAEVVEVRAMLDKLDIKYHPRLGLTKLKALLPAA